MQAQEFEDFASSNQYLKATEVRKLLSYQILFVPVQVYPYPQEVEVWLPLELVKVIHTLAQLLFEVTRSRMVTKVYVSLLDAMRAR